MSTPYVVPMNTEDSVDMLSLDTEISFLSSSEPHIQSAYNIAESRDTPNQQQLAALPARALGNVATRLVGRMRGYTLTSAERIPEVTPAARSILSQSSDDDSAFDASLYRQRSTRRSRRQETSFTDLTTLNVPSHRYFKRPTHSTGKRMSGKIKCCAYYLFIGWIVVTTTFDFGANVIATARGVWDKFDAAIGQGRSTDEKLLNILLTLPTLTNELRDIQKAVTTYEMELNVKLSDLKDKTSQTTIGLKDLSHAIARLSEQVANIWKQLQPAGATTRQMITPSLTVDPKTTAQTPPGTSSAKQQGTPGWKCDGISGC